MKVLILNGSPRAKSNSVALAEAFAEGARSAGHDVETINVAKLKVTGCLACEYCHTVGAGKCVQKDDMQELYPKLAEADMILIASPIYYWGFSGQMESVITRFYAPGKPAAKKYALLLSSGSPGVYDGPVAQYKSFVSYFGAENIGVKTFCGGSQLTAENLAEMKAFGASL